MELSELKILCDKGAGKPAPLGMVGVSGDVENFLTVL